MCCESGLYISSSRASKFWQNSRALLVLSNCNLVTPDSWPLHTVTTSHSARLIPTTMALTDGRSSPEDEDQPSPAPLTPIPQQLPTLGPWAADILGRTSSPSYRHQQYPDPSITTPDPELLPLPIKKTGVFSVKPCNCTENTPLNPCEHSQAAYSKLIQESVEQENMERAQIRQARLDRKRAERKRLKKESWERWMVGLWAQYGGTASHSWGKCWGCSIPT